MSIQVGTVHHYDGPGDRSVWLTLNVNGEVIFAHQVCPRERGQEVDLTDLAQAVADMYGIAVSVTVDEIADKATLLVSD